MKAWRSFPMKPCPWGSRKSLRIVNGQSELITPDTGILVDNGPGEELRYAQACLELLSDSDRRDAHGKGRERKGQSPISPLKTL
mgnify:CR=1 FL=1